MKWIKDLKLTSRERKKIEILIKESKVVDIKFFQNIIYLFLQNSKVILLKNANKVFYEQLSGMLEYDFLPKEFAKKKVKKRKVNDWTDSEIEYLKNNFHEIEIELLSSILNKSQYQISLKVIEEGLVTARSWSSKEIKYLEKNITISNYELAKTLKRSISSIKAKKRVLRIKNEEMNYKVLQ